jgi:CRP-like cAMP-binding protein
MAANNDDVFSTLIRKLSRLARLDEADKEAIRALPCQVKSHDANDFLVSEGEQVVKCCLLLEGYACRHKEAGDGGRQIVSFHIPGDILDLQHLLLPRADHNVQTLTPARIAWIPAARIKALAHDRPNVGDALWRDVLIDASIFREWVLNVGRRDAKTRIAHMLCEFLARRQAAGLGSPERFELPISQEHIADATGLTSVHVNRMLHELARDGAIERHRRDLRIADWPRMQRVADFDAHYLHAAA